MALRGKFPSPTEVISSFNFQSIEIKRKNLGITTLRTALQHRYATLNDIAQVYGHEVAIELISTALVKICEMSNLTVLATDQADLCSDMLYEQLKFEKIPVMHEFFKRILSTHYGIFYGSIQVMTLMSYCTAFIKDARRINREIRIEAESSVRNRKFDEAMTSDKVVSYADYLLSKNLK